MPEIQELPFSAVITKKSLIDKSNLWIRGNGSCIEWNDHNGMLPGFGTADSATLSVKACNVTIENLTVRNTFDYVSNRIKRDENVSKGMGLQAVAVYIAPGSDKIRFENCVFDSYQDTLFADGENVFFDNCKIYGNVDFIFGKAHAVFNNCTVISKSEGIVTAPSTKEESCTGLEFINCEFISVCEVPLESVYLARPWHPGGRPGVKPYVSFIDCKFGKHVNRKLWTFMKDTFGVIHTPEESRFSVDEQSLKSLI